MSMTLEEAIANREDCLKYLEGCGPMATPECVEAVRWSVKALKALRPVSREQMERAYKGEWNYDGHGRVVCSRCGAIVSIGTKNALHNTKKYDRFCFYCGAPMTDEAVEILLKRWETLHGEENS